MSDPFELRATIKRMERENTWAWIVWVVAIVAVAHFFRDDFSTGEFIIWGTVATLGLAVWSEVRGARLDTLRASLRIVLIKKDPNILNDEEWT